MSTAALIVAAGRGLRAGGGVPKQWRMLAGRTVAAHAMAALHGHPGIQALMLVVHPDDLAAGLVPRDPPAEIVSGAATRRGSVLAGLAALEGRFDRVLIHDGARPCPGPAVIDAVLGALEHGPAAAPALPMVDALWRGRDGRVVDTLPRDGLYRAQTPQGFDLAAILDAHRRFEGDAADDVGVALTAGLAVTIVDGDERNLKITGAEDFARAERIIGANMDVRVGNGFDVHRFGPGDGVILCGVAIPHSRALQGHSDADVGLHAITDAIYGALARGDIGQHFPPSDPKWKGADSAVFLRHATGLAAASGYRIGNVDCTLICEAPKIAPHGAAMRDTLAGIIGMDAGAVSIKATTTERLGFAGRGEGIAAMATVTLVQG